jgi:4-carboxymuconolactone decarboxylase
MQDEYVIDDAFRRGAELLARLSPDSVKPPWESFADIAPVLGSEVGHAFGTIVSRPGLDLRTREMATVAMLAVLGGAEPQVSFHIGGALRAGATAGEIVELLSQVSAYAGFPRALNAMAVARQVFADNGVTSLVAPRAVVVRLAAAIGDRDWSATRPLLADDLVVSLPGDPATNALAGVHRGVAGLAMLRRIATGDVVDNLTTADPVPAGDLVYLSGSCDRTGDFVAVFRTNAGAVTEVHVYES